MPIASVIRPAVEADVPAIMEILNREIETGVHCFRVRPMTAADAHAWWRARENGRYQAWVGEREGQVVGWASLSRWSAYEAYDRTAEVSIWIVPSAQRQGLGRRFFTNLVQYASEAHFRVLLSRIEANNTASIALHEHFGFTRVGTMHNVGEKFGQLLDVVIMERQMEVG